MSSLTRSVVAGVAGNAISVLCGILTLVLLARVIGAKGQAALGAALLVHQLIVMVAGFGQDTALAVTPQRSDLRRSLILGHVIGAWCVGAAVAGLLVLGAISVADAAGMPLGADFQGMLWSALYCTPFIAGVPLFVGALRGQGRVATVATVTSASSVFGLAVAVGLYAGPGITTSRAIIPYLASQLALASVLAMMTLGPRSGPSPRLDLRFTFVLIRQGAGVVVANALSLVSNRTAFLVVYATTGAAAAGQLAAVQSIAERWQVITNAVTAALTPRGAVLSPAERLGFYLGAYSRLRFLSVCLLPWAVLAGVPLLPRLLGTTFESTGLVWALVLPGAMVVGLSALLAGLVAISRNTAPAVALTLLGITLTLLGALVLSSFAGAPGAALATTLSALAVHIAWRRVVEGGGRRSRGSWFQSGPSVPRSGAANPVIAPTGFQAGATDRTSLRFIGERHWVEVLTRQWEADPRLRATPACWYPPSLAGLGLLLADSKRGDILVRVGVRPGARTFRGVAFDSIFGLVALATHPSRVAHYWIGTDVLRALHGSWRSRWKTGYVHLAGAPQLLHELNSIGVKAVLVPLSTGKPIPPLLPLPAAPLRVLSYVPRGRERFYGAESLSLAAAAMPSATFLVAGSRAEDWVRAGVTVPANVELLGWVDDFESLVGMSHVVVRLVAHDGGGGTVREALAMGRWVVYSYPIPSGRVCGVEDHQQLLASLRELEADLLKGTMVPNLEGRRFVEREYDLPGLNAKLAAALGVDTAESADLRVAG